VGVGSRSRAFRFDSARCDVVLGNVVIALLLLFGLPRPSHAQERPIPYELTSRDWLVATGGLASAGLGLYLVARSDSITLAEIGALDRQEVNGFDRGATDNWSPAWQDFSDWPRNVLLATSAALSLAPLVADDDLAEALTLGAILLETATLTAGATYIVKALAGRTRPYAYNQSLTPEERYLIAGPQEPSVHLSFYSGHAATAFAAAMLVSTVYADVHGPSTTSRIVWVATLSAASLTAFARVKGGAHFPTDVLVGAAVGSAMGRLVPALHRVDGSTGVSLSAGPGGVHLRIPVGGS
jgi:membrane-associated phospholipid phosphatase